MAKLAVSPMITLAAATLCTVPVCAQIELPIRHEWCGGVIKATTKAELPHTPRSVPLPGNDRFCSN